MKNKILLFLIITSFVHAFSAFAQTKTKGYAITVKIEGLKDTVCYMAYHYGDKQYLKDTAQVNSKGVMVFKGDEELPGGIYMIVLPSKNYFEFIVNQQTFSMETDSLDLVGKMKVKGSEDNILFYEYLNYVANKGKQIEDWKKKLEQASTKQDSAKIREEVVKLDKEVNEYRNQYAEKYPATLLAKVFNAMKDPVVPESVDSTQKYTWYKNHYFDNIDFSDDRIVRTPIFHTKLKQYFETLTLQIPDSVIKAADFMIAKARASKELFKYTTFYCTYTIETSNIMCMDQAFVHMADKYYKTGEAFWLNEKQTKRINEKADKLRNILCGKTAPNLIMPDDNGKNQVLHNLKSDYTVIVFWDPNCGHCKKAIPKLNEQLSGFTKDKVEVFAVCLENNEADWKKFIKDNNLNFINVWDPYNQTNFRKLYDISSTPSIFLIDKNKEIVAKQLGVEQIADFINRHSEMTKEKEKNKK